MHVVFIIDDNIGYLYINGELINTREDLVTSFAIANQRDLFIGKYRDFWYPLNGAVDELRIYNRALSAQEVRELFFQGFGNLYKSSAVFLRLSATQLLHGDDVTLFFDYVPYEGVREIFVYLAKDGKLRWMDRENRRWTGTRTAAGRFSRENAPRKATFRNMTLPEGEYRFGAALMPIGARWLPGSKHEVGFSMVDVVDEVQMTGKRVGEQLEHRMVPGNQAPVIQSLTVHQAGPYDRGEKVDISIVVTDPDSPHEQLFVYWDALDGGEMTGTARDGFRNVAWTAPARPGNYRVRVVVGDGDGHVARQVLNFDVR